MSAACGSIRARVVTLLWLSAHEWVRLRL